MRSIYLYLFLGLIPFFPKAQDINYHAPAVTQLKVIDTEALAAWPIISGQKITNNGQFAGFIVKVKNKGNTLSFASLDGSWKKEISDSFANNSEYYFTSGSRYAVFKINGKNKIGILKLGEQQEHYVDKVVKFNVPSDAKVDLLAYERTDSTLVIQQLGDAKDIEIQHVINFEIDPYGHFAWVTTKLMTSDPSSGLLVWIDLLKNKVTTVCKSKLYYNVIVDKPSFRRIAFVARGAYEGNDQLWYYQTGTDTAISLIDNSSPGMQGLQIDRTGRDFYFTGTGNKLVFRLDSTMVTEKRTDSRAASSVAIWNYKDQILREIMHKEHPASIAVSVALDQPGQKNKMMKLYAGDEVIKDNWGLDRYYLTVDEDLEKQQSMHLIGYGRDNESWYKNLCLISLKDGSIHKVIDGLFGKTNLLMVNLFGDYVIWFDRQQRNWFSSDANSGKITNLTASITVPLYTANGTAETDFDKVLPYGLASADAATHKIWIYDQFDIWQLDLTDDVPPVNITNGYGRLHHTVLRANGANNATSAARRITEYLRKFPDKFFLLSALDTITKATGYFKGVIGRYEAPQQLCMSAEKYPTAAIVKAADKDVYLLKKMDEDHYPNLFHTSDLRNFKPLTNFQPQKDFRWYTDEIKRWKLPDGNMAEGILYKPSDFDPQKKYPVIFYYYEDARPLHTYYMPELSQNIINIPWMVSRGYVVFEPSITYKTGTPGESAADCVISAAEYLKKEAWVDGNRLGLDGHSYGGWETNYIVTKTEMFKAAVSGGSIANDFHEAALKNFDAINNQFWFLYGQGRLGKSVWENPEIYIKNSPIFMVTKVNTPLLLMSNESDKTVDWTHGIEWFAALRQLNKKVWLINYGDEGHSLRKTQNQLDWTIRMTQFFDYYLKDALPPVWMTKGLPEEDKKKDTGLELDRSGAIP